MGRYKYSVYNTEARMRVGKGRARERGREGKRERDTFKPLSLSLSIPSSHLHPPSRPRSLPSLSSLSPPPPATHLYLSLYHLLHLLHVPDHVPLPCPKRQVSTKTSQQLTHTCAHTRVYTRLHTATTLAACWPSAHGDFLRALCASLHRKPRCITHKAAALSHTYTRAHVHKYMMHTQKYPEHRAGGQ